MLEVLARAARAAYAHGWVPPMPDHFEMAPGFYCGRDLRNRNGVKVSRRTAWTAALFAAFMRGQGPAPVPDRRPR